MCNCAGWTIIIWKHLRKFDSEKAHATNGLVVDWLDAQAFPSLIECYSLKLWFCLHYMDIVHTAIALHCNVCSRSVDVSMSSVSVRSRFEFQHFFVCTRSLNPLHAFYIQMTSKSSTILWLLLLVFFFSFRVDSFIDVLVWRHNRYRFYPICALWACILVMESFSFVLSICEMT